MKSALIETHFLPSIEFFCALATVDRIEIEYFEHYVKQSYRNHAIINTANGPFKLVVPLASKGNRTLVKDLIVDYAMNWPVIFWRTIESAYRNAPFFEHYADDLKQILSNRYKFLVDLNADLLKLAFHWLRWEKEIIPTTQYNKNSSSLDLRNIVLSKKPYNSRNFYRPVPYTQVFGNSFVENLCIADLVFCKGPEASGIIHSSGLNL